MNLRKILAVAVALAMVFGLMSGIAVAGNDDEEERPAAPAVANRLLDEAGEDRRYGFGPNGGNYIRDVAQEMGPGADFDGISKCEVDEYEVAVAEFLVEQGADIEVPEPEPVPDEGEVINVTQDETYDAIQAAVHEAEAGDEIHVGLGTYNEAVEIEEGLDGLILKGTDERPEVVSDAHGIRIVDVEDVSIKNFIVREAGGRGVYATRTDGILVDNVLAEENENDGIRVRESVDATVKNSASLRNNGDGITFYSYGSVLNNEVGDNVERGIYHNGRSADSGTGHVTISGNEVYGNQMDHEWIDHHAAGIEVYAGRDGKHTLSAEVEDNILYDNKGNGILLYKVNHETGEGMVSDDNQSIVRGNKVYGTVDLDGKTPVGDGILIYKSHYVLVEENEEDNNEHAGVRVTVDYKYDFSDEFPVEGNQVINNELTNNYYGVLIESGAEDTVVEGNTYEGNEVDEKYDY